MPNANKPSKGRNVNLNKWLLTGCGTHVFEGFFGLENGPVKYKSQEKTLFGKDFPKPAKTQS